MQKPLAIRPSDDAQSNINAIARWLNHSLPQGWNEARIYVEQNNGISEWKGHYSLGGEEEISFAVHGDIVKCLETLRSENNRHCPISSITFHGDHRYEIKYDHSTSERLPLSVIQEEIKKLKEIDLRKTDVDSLRTRIGSLTIGYRLTSPKIAAGTILYRGVQGQEQPCAMHQLSYAPEEKVKKLHRAGRPQQPLFYCSLDRNAVFYEVGVAAGDRVVVSQWECTDSLLVNNVGYRPDTLENLGSNRECPSWGNGTCPKEFENHNKIIGEFFAEEFTKRVPVGQEHLYKLSVAIAEQHFQHDMFDGLMYPAIAMSGNADNLAIKPIAVDKKLAFKKAEYFQIEEHSDNSYKMTWLDFANSVSCDDKIEWKGRLPQWKIGKKGEMLMLKVENGTWVARNSSGEVVEPE